MIFFVKNERSLFKNNFYLFKTRAKPYRIKPKQILSFRTKKDKSSEGAYINVRDRVTTQRYAVYKFKVKPSSNASKTRSARISRWERT